MAKKFLTDINIAGGVYDSSGDIGNSGQVLSSTGSGVNWINATSSASIVYQDGFTGDGSTTAFTLANSIDNENKTQVYIDGVYQHKDNYSLSGTTLTFSTAPPNSSDIEVISFSSVSAADDILYDDDFASAGLMTTNGSGVYSITTNNSSNWNTAYTYSQVGHLPLSGGAITGAITTNSTFDGRDISVDGTKLDGIEANATADQTDAEIRAAVEAATDSNVFTDADHSKLNGIEASADVTDTANVTAAGALMDSEVTNLADVKAFDTTDYATAAQGVKADSAQQPPSEGAFVNGDKTKLDGIAAGAEVNVQSDWNSTSGDSLILNKPSIPSITGLASETYVDTAVSNLVDSAPGTLDTLNELAAALGDDANFSTTVTNSIATKLPLAGGTLTGGLTGTTATFSTVQISNGVSYNENIRMFPSSSNDYSSLILGAVSGTSGTGVGQWTLVRYPTATHSNKFTIRHNSTDHVTIATAGNVTNHVATFSPIFYDSNNTSYYINPAANSELSTATFAGDVQIDTSLSIGKAGGASGIGNLTLFSRYSVAAPYISFKTDHPSQSTVWETGRIDSTDSGNFNGKMLFKVATGNGSAAGGASMSTVLTLDDDSSATFAGTITASGYNDSNWNTAYSWGNHASAGYLTSLPSHNHAASDITSGQLAAARNTNNLVNVGSTSDASGIYFRGTTEVISGEGWCTAQYAYNHNDGFLFLNRNSSNTAFPTFHIGGWNNAGHAGYTDADGMITLTRSDGSKSQGAGYAGTGLSNTSYWTRMVKTTAKTIFKDAQGKHEFDGDLAISGSGLASSPNLSISNSSTSAFMHSGELFTANMTAGQANIFVIGKEGSTRQAGYIGYNWAASASNNNYVTIGHWGVDHLFRVYGDVITTTVGIRSDADVRGTIFYDTNDTNYYVNPAANSVLTTAMFNVNANSTISLNAAGTNASQIKAGAGDELYLGGNNTWQMRLSGGNILMDNGGYALSNGSMRAPIFYDSGDTAYYADMNSLSHIRKIAGVRTNLATSEGWQETGAWNTGNQTGYFGGSFTINGSSNENNISWEDGPSGTRPTNKKELVWKVTTNSSDSGADGGWNKTITGIDYNKSHISILYVKRVADGNGNFYHGTTTCLNLDGTTNTNPYFQAGSAQSLPLNVWCVSIGFLRANNDTASTAATSWSGVYRLDTGERILGATDFRLSQSTTSQHRCFLYYATQVATEVWFANPGFYEINGNEPKLSEILMRPEDRTDSLRTDVDMRAPIFYDFNNTGYYINPYGQSKIRNNNAQEALIIEGDYPQLTIRTTNIADASIHFDAGFSKKFNIGPGAGGAEEDEFGFAIYDGPRGTHYGTPFRISADTGYVQVGDKDHPGYPLDVLGTAYSSADFRAPIFYDSNDTGYYTDSSSISRMSSIWFGKGSNDRNGAVSIALNDGQLLFRTNTDYNHKMWYYDGLNFSTNPSHGHIRFWADGSSRTNGSGGTTIVLDSDCQNIVTKIYGQTQSPVYYDLNDTNYYINGNSGSRLLRLGLNVAPDLGVAGDVLKIQGGNNGLGCIKAISGSMSYGVRIEGSNLSTQLALYTSSTSQTTQINFEVAGNGSAGKITTTTNTTTYTTSSDYRLKENVVPMSNSISRLNQLKPNRFNFIGEPDRTVDGFLAHEVQEIVPEAVVGEKDAVDDDGNIVSQGIDQAKLVPLLVAAIQELEARVKELENN